MTISPARVCDVGKQVLEAARLGFGQPRQELLDAVLDRNLLGRQIDLRPLLGAFDHGAERGDQAEQIDFDLRLGRLAGDLGDRTVRTRPLRAAQRLALVQQFGRRLVLLVFEQAADQRFARILVGIFLRPGSGRGSSIRDLMWISVAAITRNSPATSRFSSCIRSMYSRYCCVMSAIGMS